MVDDPSKELREAEKTARHAYVMGYKRDPETRRAWVDALLAVIENEKKFGRGNMDDCKELVADRNAAREAFETASADQEGVAEAKDRLEKAEDVVKKCHELINI